MARAATTVALALVVVPALAPAAHAAAYRYWTYWSGSSGTWAFATMGPAQSLPADGSVEGWRFAVTTESGSAGDAPRAEPSFSAICDGTPAVAGNKRVALVVDPGLPEHAPAGESPASLLTACVTADEDATGYQVLRDALEVRIGDDGLVCGIGGYPVAECATLVESFDGADGAPGTDDADAQPTAQPTAQAAVQDAGADPDAPTAVDAADSPMPLVAGIALLGALLAGVVVVRRRRA